MAKTIKEMAEEYAYTNWQSDDYHEGAAEGLPFDAIGHTERTYMAGASAVLEEIEKEIMRSFLEDFNGMTEHDREIAQGAIAMIKIMIQRLKGE